VLRRRHVSVCQVGVVMIVRNQFALHLANRDRYVLDLIHVHVLQDTKDFRHVMNRSVCRIVFTECVLDQILVDVRLDGSIRTVQPRM